MPDLVKHPPEGMGETRSFTASVENTRLDRHLTAHYPETSRSQITRWIKQGHVQVNGQVVKPSHLLQLYDRVTCTPPPRAPTNLVAQALPLPIIYQDQELVVVNKPAGLVVHPGAGHPDGTMVNALLYHIGDLSPVGQPHRPGIVHRLDRETSGLLVVARTERAHHHLAEQISGHKMERTYEALVWDHGLAESGSYRTLYGRHPQHRIQFTSRCAQGKTAITHWRVLEFWHPCAYIQLRLETGRTHQIRVHMSEAGHPLLGDPLYGRRRRVQTPEQLKRRGWELGMTRQALHAASLRFQHPRTQEFISFQSPAPEDFMDCLQTLRGQRPLSELAFTPQPEI